MSYYVTFDNAMLRCFLAGILVLDSTGLGIYVQGVCVLGGKCPGGKCTGGKCPGGFMSGGKCPGDTCPLFLSCHHLGSNIVSVLLFVYLVFSSIRF